ncbi:MAG: hypothetical protein GQE15_14190 [Archangiaceae bacterium]|nr:hypothetical protein [Archangiaceae bacterium]
MSELGSETNELLRKARQGTPAMPNDVRRRVRGAVLTGAGLTTVAAGVSFAKVVAIGVVSASVATIATFTVTKQVFERRALAAEQRALAAEQALAARPAPVVEPAVVVEPAPVAVETVTPPVGDEKPTAAPTPRVIVATSKPTPAPQAAPTPEPVVDDRSLAAELETLEGILHATDVANWAEARVRLGAYHSRFEDGHFRTEARALEVLTLCGEHHVEAARALRGELLKLEPLNPAVLRLAGSCAAD